MRLLGRQKYEKFMNLVNDIDLLKRGCGNRCVNEKCKRVILEVPGIEIHQCPYCNQAIKIDDTKTESKKVIIDLNANSSSVQNDNQTRTPYEEHGSFKIYLDFVGSCFDLSVTLNDTGKTLKSKVFEELPKIRPTLSSNPQYKQETIYLTYNGKILRDDGSLGEFNLQNRSKLRVILKF